MDNIMMQDVRKLCTGETLFMTQHSHDRCRERGISYQDIVSAVMNGRIIEQYPTDTPFPSCLILGVSTRKKLLHLVCSIGSGKLWIITAYWPDKTKWNDDFTVRKEN